jgi:hypothetical protein
MIKNIFIIIICAAVLAYPQKSPPEKNNFQKLTSYEELSDFVAQLGKSSDLLKVKIAGQSVEGRNIYGLNFSSGISNDGKRLKVLFFAQQHGNEHSGKEGALLLASELIKPEYNYLFEKIDLVLIPQLNPDGSEVNKRYNGNNADLNRNHLILTEPETIVLHKLFNENRFDVTLDIHEYYPYSKSWENYGYYKRADEQFGILTNLNAAEEIRSYSKEYILPAMKKLLEREGYSFNEYIVGGPPDISRIRHSTVDIDDGRQSFGLQNTLSFILEGINGRESVSDMEKRAKGQFTAMLSLLKCVYDDAENIKNMVDKKREDLLAKNGTVILRMEHTDNMESIYIPVTDVSQNLDTSISLNNYHDKVISLEQTIVPEGYLLLRSDSLLMNFIHNHSIRFSENIPEDVFIERYQITGIDTIEIEELYKKDIKCDVQIINIDFPEKTYVYIPAAQLKKNIIALAFEPRSMLALLHYDKFNYLAEKETYPILRVIKK